MAPTPHHFGILATTVMWMAMMTVMMLPALLPWLWGFAALSRDREAGTIRPAWVALFGLGYVVVWTGFSVAAAALHVGIQSLGLMETSIGGVTSA